MVGKVGRLLFWWVSLGWNWKLLAVLSLGWGPQGVNTENIKSLRESQGLQESWEPAYPPSPADSVYEGCGMDDEMRVAQGPLTISLILWTICSKDGWFLWSRQGWLRVTLWETRTSQNPIYLCIWLVNDKDAEAVVWALTELFRLQWNDFIEGLTLV